MSRKWEISLLNSSQAEHGTSAFYTLCALPKYKAMGRKVANVSPLLPLNLKHFTARKSGAGRSGRKKWERLPRSWVRTSRKDLCFHIYIWHLSCFPGKGLASRVCSTDNATSFNIPFLQYFSISLMKVLFYVLLHNGHKILTLARSWWAICWRILTLRWRWRCVIDIHLHSSKSGMFSLDISFCSFFFFPLQLGVTHNMCHNTQ